MVWGEKGANRSTDNSFLGLRTIMSTAGGYRPQNYGSEKYGLITQSPHLTYYAENVCPLNSPQCLKTRSAARLAVPATKTYTH